MSAPCNIVNESILKEIIAFIQKPPRVDVNLLKPETGIHPKLQETSYFYISQPLGIKIEKLYYTDLGKTT
jgi:hypothetical protein